MALQFIAQTPRAGRWHHRILVPTQHALSETETLDYISRASAEPVGKDYLACSQAVRQTSTGRSGHELLVLKGVAGTRLNDTQRQALQIQLEARLQDLAALVQRIDWEQEGKGLLLVHAELDAWAKALKLAPECCYFSAWQRLLRFLKLV